MNETCRCQTQDNLISAFKYNVAVSNINGSVNCNFHPLTVDNQHNRVSSSSFLISVLL